jgi:predicted nucleotidyltransferase
VRVEIYLGDGVERKFRQVHPLNVKRGKTFQTLEKMNPKHLLTGKQPIVLDPAAIYLNTRQKEELKFPLDGQGGLYAQIARSVRHYMGLSDDEFAIVILSSL